MAPHSTGTIEIGGFCVPEFASLREAFAENFTDRGDVGAAVALVRDGELVVDLWAGSLGRDTATLPWRHDSLVNVWSTTKGVVALCFAMLVDRGQLRYGDRVAKHWPEFGAAGKGAVTVAMLLSHQAGLCAFRDRARVEDLYDQPAAAARLVAQTPFWEPGSRFGYHALTIGILANELFRRIEGRTLGAFIRSELTEPFGLDFHIGLPAQAFARAAPILGPPDLAAATVTDGMTEAQLATFTNPTLEPEDANTAAWRAAELPSANGFGNARGLARLYGALAADGRLEGRPLIDVGALHEATRECVSGTDEVRGVPLRWAAGFLLNSNGVYGRSPRAFGHSGWGGSFAFADPDRRLALAYTMNRMGTHLMSDPRNLELIAAVEEAVANP